MDGHGQVDGRMDGRTDGRTDGRRTDGGPNRPTPVIPISVDIGLTCAVRTS